MAHLRVRANPSMVKSFIICFVLFFPNGNEKKRVWWRNNWDFLRIVFLLAHTAWNKECRRLWNAWDQESQCTDNWQIKEKKQISDFLVRYLATTSHQNSPWNWFCKSLELDWVNDLSSFEIFSVVMVGGSSVKHHTKISHRCWSELGFGHYKTHSIWFTSFSSSSNQWVRPRACQRGQVHPV